MSKDRQPPLVYLDTQDYIKAFNETSEGQNRKILDRLTQLRKEGLIRIGFSFATVVEFITKPDVQNREDRVRRGALLKDVCGPNAFPYITDLARGAGFPNGGVWLPNNATEVVSAKSFRRTIHKALLDRLSVATELNRKQRRQFGRKSALHDIIRQFGDPGNAMQEVTGRMPVSKELISSRIVERFVQGLCSDAEFERAMNSWLSDPEEYSRLIYDHLDYPNMKDSMFGQSISKLEESIRQIQDAVEEFARLRASVASTRKDLVALGIEKRKARSMTRQISVPTSFDFKIGDRLESFLGKGRSAHFDTYMTEVAKKSFKFKPSDAMDLMQLCYAYDCDLFRCDKAMANLFQSYPPFANKLVSRFDQLLDRIQSRLT